MERRELLKKMAFSVWGLMLLPGCDLGKSKSISVSPLSLSDLQMEALTEAVDTLIPSNDTPGAVDLQVHQFIDNILFHCYEKEEQEIFLRGLDSLQEKSRENYSITLGACSKEQMIEILINLELSNEEAEKKFYFLLKELTILGYTTSEYVMTKLSDYEMMPGHFYGCVPVNPSKINS
jgi:hypothetical protein